MKWIAVSTRLEPSLVLEMEQGTHGSRMLPAQASIRDEACLASTVRHEWFERSPSLIIVCSATAMSNGLYPLRGEISAPPGTHWSSTRDHLAARGPPNHFALAVLHKAPVYPSPHPPAVTQNVEIQAQTGKAEHIRRNESDRGTMGFSKISRRFSG